MKDNLEIPKKALAMGAQIAPLPEDMFLPASSPRWHYLGARLSDWMIKGDRSEFAGAVSGLDVVLSWGFPEAVASFSALKAMGIPGVSVLPAYVLRKDPSAGRFVSGVTMAYEHTCARVLVGNAKDKAKLASLGMPPEKLETIGMLNYQRRFLEGTVEKHLSATHDAHLGAANVVSVIRQVLLEFRG